MASASRSTESPSAPVDLRIYNWSAVLDVLRGAVDVLERDPSFIEEYDHADVESVYRHVARRVESETAVGDAWRRVIAVDLTASQMTILTTTLEVCHRSTAIDDLPETLPDLTAVARDITLQHEARR